ncbi:MAG: CsgG/HfaB family protein [Candidatus Cloacimonetes bacterium]|nr:CsgG/HfaB family protein [Candidatus Cloacimonadota bacterium]
MKKILKRFSIIPLLVCITQLSLYGFYVEAGGGVYYGTSPLDGMRGPAGHELKYVDPLPGFGGGVKLGFGPLVADNLYIFSEYSFYTQSFWVYERYREEWGMESGGEITTSTSQNLLGLGLTYYQPLDTRDGSIYFSTSYGVLSGSFDNLASNNSFSIDTGSYFKASMGYSFASGLLLGLSFSNHSISIPKIAIDQSSSIFGINVGYALRSKRNLFPEIKTQRESAARTRSDAQLRGNIHDAVTQAINQSIGSIPANSRFVIQLVGVERNLTDDIVFAIESNMLSRSFSVVSMEDLDRIIEQQNITRGQEFDRNARATIGRFTGAGYILDTRFVTSGGQRFLQIRILDMTTAEVRGTGRGNL